MVLTTQQKWLYGGAGAVVLLGLTFLILWLLGVFDTATPAGVTATPARPLGS